jgi:hypothetical protein
LSHHQKRCEKHLSEKELLAAYFSATRDLSKTHSLGNQNEILPRATNPTIDHPALSTCPQQCYSESFARKLLRASSISCLSATFTSVLRFFANRSLSSLFAALILSFSLRVVGRGRFPTRAIKVLSRISNRAL